MSTILKVKKKNSLQNHQNLAMSNSKWDIYTPVHCILNWCQLHHYHIYYIMRKQETIHLTTFFHSQMKTLLLFPPPPPPPDYLMKLIWNFPPSVTCHVHLCIIINLSLSLYHCRKHKPTFQSINNWWLTLIKVLIFPCFLKIQLEL